MPLTVHFGSGDQERSERTARRFIHEIMNPVGSMSLSVESLNLEHNGVSTLNILERSLDKLISLVQDYSYAIRQPALHLTDVSVGELLDQSIQKVNHEYDTDKSSIRQSNIHPGLKLSGDRNKLTEALAYLLMNALEAGGHEIELIAGENDEYINLQIRDDGKGIDKNISSSIFEPLSTDKPGHKGLGLTAAASILTAHGADIKAESVPGHFTSFIIRFPKRSV